MTHLRFRINQFFSDFYAENVKYCPIVEQVTRKLKHRFLFFDNLSSFSEIRHVCSDAQTASNDDPLLPMQIISRSVALCTRLANYEGGTKCSNFCKYMESCMEQLEAMVQNDFQDIISALSIANFARSLAYVCLFHNPDFYYPLCPSKSRRLESDKLAHWVEIAQGIHNQLLKSSESLHVHDVHSEIVRSEISRLCIALRAIQDPERKAKYFSVAADIFSGIGRLVISRGSDGLIDILKGLGRCGGLLIESNEQESAHRLFLLESWIELEFKRLERVIDEIVQVRDPKRRENKAGQSYSARQLESQQNSDTLKVKLEEVKKDLRAVQAFALHDDMPLDAAICFALCLSEFALGSSWSPAQRRSVDSPSTGALRLPRLASLPREFALWFFDGDSNEGERERFMGIRGLAMYGQPTSVIRDGDNVCLPKSVQRALRMRDRAKYMYEQLESNGELDLALFVDEVQGLIQDEWEETMEQVLQQARQFAQVQAVKELQSIFASLKPLLVAEDLDNQTQQLPPNGDSISKEWQFLDKSFATFIADLTQNVTSRKFQNSQSESEATTRIKTLTIKYLKDYLVYLHDQLDQTSIFGPKFAIQATTAIDMLYHSIEKALAIAEAGQASLKKFIETLKVTNHLLKQSLVFIKSALTMSSLFKELPVSCESELESTVTTWSHCAWILSSLGKLKEGIQTLQGDLSKATEKCINIQKKAEATVKDLKECEAYLLEIRSREKNRNIVLNDILKVLTRLQHNDYLCKILIGVSESALSGYHVADDLVKISNKCRFAVSALLSKPFSIACNGAQNSSTRIYVPECTVNGDIVYQLQSQTPQNAEDAREILKLDLVPVDKSEGNQDVDWRRWCAYETSLSGDVPLADGPKTYPFDTNKIMFQNAFHDLSGREWEGGYTCSILPSKLVLPKLTTKALDPLLDVAKDLRSVIEFSINLQDDFNLTEILDCSNALDDFAKNPIVEQVSVYFTLFRRANISPKDSWRIRYIAINLLQQIICSLQLLIGEPQDPETFRGTLEAVASNAESVLHQRTFVEPDRHVKWCLKHNGFAVKMMTQRMKGCTVFDEDSKQKHGKDLQALMLNQRMVTAQEKQARTQDLILEHIRSGVKEKVISRKDDLVAELSKLKERFEKGENDQNWHNFVSNDSILIKTFLCCREVSELNRLSKTSAFSIADEEIQNGLKQIYLQSHDLRISKNALVNKPMDNEDHYNEARALLNKTVIDKMKQLTPMDQHVSGLYDEISSLKALIEELKSANQQQQTGKQNDVLNSQPISQETFKLQVGENTNPVLIATISRLVREALDPITRQMQLDQEHMHEMLSSLQAVSDALRSANPQQQASLQPRMQPEVPSLIALQPSNLEILMLQMSKDTKALLTATHSIPNLVGQAADSIKGQMLTDLQLLDDKVSSLQTLIDALPVHSDLKKMRQDIESIIDKAATAAERLETARAGLSEAHNKSVIQNLETLQSSMGESNSVLKFLIDKIDIVESNLTKNQAQHLNQVEGVILSRFEELSSGFDLLAQKVSSLNLPDILDQSSMHTLQKGLGEMREKWNRDLKAVRLIQSEYNLSANTLDARAVERDINSLHLVAKSTIERALEDILPQLKVVLQGLNAVKGAAQGTNDAAPQLPRSESGPSEQQSTGDDAAADTGVPPPSSRSSTSRPSSESAEQLRQAEQQKARWSRKAALESSAVGGAGRPVFAAEISQRGSAGKVSSKSSDMLKPERSSTAAR